MITHISREGDQGCLKSVLDFGRDLGGGEMFVVLVLLWLLWLLLLLLGTNLQWVENETHT